MEKYDKFFLDKCPCSKTSMLTCQGKTCKICKAARHILRMKTVGTFSIEFTANGKRLLAVWGFPFAVGTKIDFSIALTSFGGKKSLFIFFKVF